MYTRKLTRIAIESKYAMVPDKIAKRKKNEVGKDNVMLKQKE